MQEPLRALVNPTQDHGDAIVHVDTGFRVLRWNEAATHVLGFRADEVLGRAYFSLLSDRERDNGDLERALTDACRKETPQPIRAEHRTKHGDPTTLIGVCVPVRMADGAFDGWLLILHQSIETQCLNCGLLRHVGSVVADSTDAVLVLDDRDRVVSWSRGAKGLYGYVATEAVGKTIEELLVPEDAPGPARLLRAKAEHEGFIRNIETVHRTNDGRSVRVEITWSFVRDSRGIGIGSILVARDVTTRRLLEERLLHTERLAIVGRMAAQVAHELRNPLSSMSLNAELLADELAALPDQSVGEARVLLDSIAKEIERLASVSEEYLQFARMPELSPAPTDVSLLVEDLAQFAELELARAGVTVRVEATPVPTLPVDRKQLRQALLNLIRNALEEMKEGGTLTLSTHNVDTGDVVEIRVADTGSGIPEGYEEQVFEPFVSMKEGGTGLGLAFSRRVAHEHGGELSYRPTPGGGATFVLRLPVVPPGTVERRE